MFKHSAWLLCWALLLGGAPPAWADEGGGAGAARIAPRSTDPQHTTEDTKMAPVSVRYIVTDVDAAIKFYTQHLGFQVGLHPAPGFAMLSRGNLRLLLSAPTGRGGAAQPMPDGRKPEPGGWNRIQLPVDDLAGTVATLRNAGVHFRNDIVTGFGGKQILVDDPAGNPIELFEAPPR